MNTFSLAAMGEKKGEAGTFPAVDENTNHLSIVTITYIYLDIFMRWAVDEFCATTSSKIEVVAAVSPFRCNTNPTHYFLPCTIKIFNFSCPPFVFCCDHFLSTLFSLLWALVISYCSFIKKFSFSFRIFSSSVLFSSFTVIPYYDYVLRY